MPAYIENLSESIHPMAPKRQLDANSTGSPLSKRLRIAQPILQRCEALLEETGMTPRTYGPLGILGLLLDEQSQQGEPPQDEDELQRDGENRLTVPDEYVSESYHVNRNTFLLIVVETECS